MPSSLALYRQQLGTFVAWLDDRPVAADTITAFLLSLRDRGLSQDTQSNFHRQIKTLCRWLIDEELLHRDPYRGKGKVSAPPRKRKRRITYTDDEIIRLLGVTLPAHWKQERRTTRQQWQPGGPLEREALQARAVVLLAIDSGLRGAEMCRLNCGDVRHDRPLDVLSKGGHEDLAFLGPTPRRLLLELAADRPPDDPLIRNWAGGRCTPDALRNIVCRLARRAEVVVPPRPVHAFRHWAARNWARAKLPDTVVMHLMRHTNIATTQIYTQVDPLDLERLHAAASSVDRLLALAELRESR